MLCQVCGGCKWDGCPGRKKPVTQGTGNCMKHQELRVNTSRLVFSPRVKSTLAWEMSYIVFLNVWCHLCVVQSFLPLTSTSVPLFDALKEITSSSVLQFFTYVEVTIMEDHRFLNLGGITSPVCLKQETSQHSCWLVPPALSPLTQCLLCCALFWVALCSHLSKCSKALCYFDLNYACL